MRRGLLGVCAGALISGSAAGSADVAPTTQPFDPAAIRAVLKKTADWQLDHPRGEPGEWTNAVFYAGLLAAHAATGEGRYLEEVVRVGERLQWRPGSRYRHADDHAIAQTYLDLYELRRDPRMLSSFRETVDRMMATPADWEKPHQEIDYWWSDALFMSPPAMTRLAKSTGDEKYLDFMDRLWRQSYDLLWDDEAHLFYRDLRFRERSVGEFWSRGNAWVLAGIARMLEDLPDDRPTRELYVRVFREMAETVAAIQPADGLWRSNLLESRTSIPGETSGTALFCYALTWGMRTGVLERDHYRPVVERAWAGLYGLVNDDGRLGWVQKPGASPHATKERNWAVYGTGAFLLAGSELLMLGGK